MEAIPSTGAALVALLDQEFPLRNPNPKTTHADLLYAAGQRSVVEYLLNIQAQENEK